MPADAITSGSFCVFLSTALRIEVATQLID
jgi:hypothetical protein